MHVFGKKLSSSFRPPPGRILLQISFSLLGVLAPVAGPALAQGPVQSASQSPITVRGVVLTSSDHKPIAGAAVHLVAGTRGDVLHYRDAVTDEAGRFVFGKVPPLLISVGTYKAGYLCDILLRVRPHPNCFVEKDPRNRDVDVTLTMLPEAVVTGRVVGESGEPVEKLGVGVLRREIEDGRYVWRAASETKTDANGVYRIGELEPGTYRVRTAAAVSMGHDYGMEATKDTGYEAQWYPGSATEEGAKALMLNAGEEQHADFKVKQSLMLVNLPYAWTLPDETGDMGYGMSDDLRPMPESHHMFQVYAPMGHYTFNLCIYPPAPGGRRQPWSNGSTEPYCGFSEFNIVANMMSAPTVALEQPVRIPVEVRFESSGAGQSAPGPPAQRTKQVLFVLTPGGNSLWNNQVTWTAARTDGDLAFKNVHPGAYSVRARAEGAYVASLTCGKVDLLREPLVVGADVPRCAVEAVVRDDFGSVAVGIAPESIAAMRAAEVWGADLSFICLENGPPAGPAGSVFLGQPTATRQVPPGRYLVFLSDGRALAWREPGELEQLMKLGKVITVASGQTQTVLVDWPPELNEAKAPEGRLGSFEP